MSILDKASLIQIPSGYKNGKLYSVKPNPSYGSEQISNGDFSNGSTGWTVSNGTVTDKYNASMTAYQNGIKISTFSLSGTYKLIFDLTITSGNCKFDGGGSNSQTYTTSGRKELTITNPTKFEFNAFNLGWVGTLDNVSVKEVLVADGDFTFARSSSATRVNSEGLIETAEILTDELAINGDFDTDSDWTKGSGWSIVNGEAVHTGSGDYIEQGSLTQGKNYRVVIVVTQASGSGFPQIYMGGLTTAMTSPNTYTFDITAQSGDKIKLRGLNDCKVDSISVKELFQNDVPRLDYSGGATCPTLLLEPQRTNLNIQSNSSFVINNCTIDYNNATSPEGITNAYRATATGTSASFVRSLNIAFTDPSAFSVFLKHGNNEWMQIINAGNVNHYVNVNIETGDLGTFGSNTSDLLVEDYGNGWYRVSGKFSGYTGTGTLRVYQTNSSSSGWASTTATIGNYYYGYGFQVESNASYATSYIPTNGATATRTADVCDNAGTSATFNDAEGVLFAEIAALADDLTSRVISLNDGSTSNRVIIVYQTTTSSIRVVVSSGGSVQFDSNTQNYDITNFNKIALKYKENDFALWINGTEVLTDTSVLTPIGLNNLEFNNANGISNFYGKCKQLIVFDEALSDSELQALTTL